MRRVCLGLDERSPGRAARCVWLSVTLSVLGGISIIAVVVACMCARSRESRPDDGVCGDTDSEE